MMKQSINQKDFSAVNLLNRYFFFLFSAIPLSIIAGSSIALINIILIFLPFFLLLFKKKNLIWIKDINVQFLLLLYLYLIFNTFISLDYTEAIARNFGFIRFILLFIVINFFFQQKSFNKVFNVWLVILLIVIFDVFFESFNGTNLLGYGETFKWDAAFGGRIVSFFKDEPIVGAYLIGFFLIIVGYSFNKYNDYNAYLRLAVIFLSLVFLFAIIISGERANSIKALVGFAIFYALNKNFSLKKKVTIFTSMILVIFILVSNSNFLKMRYGFEFLQKFSSKEKIETLYKEDIYLQLYKSSFKVFQNYPIFGVGNKNYRYETCDGGKTRKVQIPGYYCITHPHQVYFEFLSEHGLVGFIILLSILFFLIFRNLKIILLSRNYIQIGCLIYLILIFLPLIPSGSFFNDFNSTLFWINFSLMYAVNKETNIFTSNK